MKLIEASAALIILLSAAFCASGQTYLDTGAAPVYGTMEMEREASARQSKFARQLAAKGEPDRFHTRPIGSTELSPNPTDEWRRYYREIHGKEWQAVQKTQYAEPYCVDEYGNRVPCNQQQQPVRMASAHCRINVTGDGATGSGTLIHKSATLGLVATCSHMFDGAQSRVIVNFDNGERFAAKIIYRDRTHDVAGLLIRRPNATPIPYDETEPSGVLTIAGYGMNGRLRMASGPIVDEVTPQGGTDKWKVIQCSARSGDSGGGVFRNGRFVGVIWGNRDGQAYLTVGRPIRNMLDSAMPNRSGAIIARNDQVAPPGYRVAAITPATPPGWQAAAYQPRQASNGSPGGAGGYNGNGNGWTNGGYPPMQPPYEQQPPAEHTHDDILQIIERQNNLIIQIGESVKQSTTVIHERIDENREDSADLQRQLSQMQRQNADLKNDIKNDINIKLDERLRPIEDNPPPTPEEIADELARRPISLRVRNPRTGFTSEYVEIYPGKKATIEMELEPAQ